MKKNYRRRSTIGMRLSPMDHNLNTKIPSVGFHASISYLIEISIDFHIQNKPNQISNQSWFDYDMSPLRIWLEHSISPLIHVQLVQTFNSPLSLNFISLDHN